MSRSPRPEATTPLRRSNRARATAKEIPDATIARLPIYHRVLGQLAETGVTTVSSEELAQACGVSSAKLPQGPLASRLVRHQGRRL